MPESQRGKHGLRYLRIISKIQGFRKGSMALTTVSKNVISSSTLSRFGDIRLWIGEVFP